MNRQRKPRKNPMSSLRKTVSRSIKYPDDREQSTAFIEKAREIGESLKARVDNDLAATQRSQVLVRSIFVAESVGYTMN
ncbi:MAG: hypothetical protein ACREC4_02120 [Methylocella sp.]